MGEYAKAKPLYQEALRIYQKVLGEERPDTVTSLNNLATLYQAMGEYAKAEPLYQEALRIRQKVLGPEHPYTAQSLNNLGALYVSMGEYAKAEPLDQEALRIHRKVLGKEHPEMATSLENLALLEFDLGRIDEATALARQASASELTILSKIFSFTSEQQRLAYLDIFHPYYSLFPILKGTETDLAEPSYATKAWYWIRSSKIACWLKQAREVKTRTLWSNSTWIKANWASCFCNPKSSLLRQTSESRHSKGR